MNLLLMMKWRIEPDGSLAWKPWSLLLATAGDSDGDGDGGPRLLEALLGADVNLGPKFWDSSNQSGRSLDRSGLDRRTRMIEVRIATGARGGQAGWWYVVAAWKGEI